MDEFGRSAMPGPRYDRIVPAVTLVLAGLGVAFVLDAGQRRAVLELGAGLPEISISWIVLAVVALSAALSVEMIARSHPRFSPRWLTPVRLGGRIGADLLLPLWALPALTPVAVFAFFRLFGGALQTGAYLVILLATGALLLLVFGAQHRLLTGDPSNREAARTTLGVIAYSLAFAIFAAVEFNRYRTLYAAALLFPSSTLLAYDLLRGRIHQPWASAVVIAVAIVQSYWALTYWPAPFLLNGVALLVIFYVAIGLVVRSGNKGLTRAALLEYGLLAGLWLVALAVASVVLQTRLDQLME